MWEKSIASCEMKLHRGVSCSEDHLQLVLLTNLAFLRQASTSDGNDEHI